MYYAYYHMPTLLTEVLLRLTYRKSSTQDSKAVLSNRRYALFDRPRKSIRFHFVYWAHTNARLSETHLSEFTYSSSMVYYIILLSFDFVNTLLNFLYFFLLYSTSKDPVFMPFPSAEKPRDYKQPFSSSRSFTIFFTYALNSAPPSS